jgi:hypothetical protein
MLLDGIVACIVGVVGLLRGLKCPNTPSRLSFWMVLITFQQASQPPAFPLSTISAAAALSPGAKAGSADIKMPAAERAF